MNTLIGKPLNSLFSWYIEKRIKEINGFMSNPIITQENILLQNLQKAKKPTIGRIYGFDYISNSEMYKKIVPLHNYSDLAFEIGKKVNEDFDEKKLPLMLAMINAITNDKKLQLNWELF